jgi:succinate-acetate transporter protein
MISKYLADLRYLLSVSARLSLVVLSAVLVYDLIFGTILGPNTPQEVVLWCVAGSFGTVFGMAALYVTTCWILD